jgi:hypothetical protein
MARPIRGALATLAAAVLLLGLPPAAQAFLLDNQLFDDFSGGLGSWTIVGTANTRPSTDAINTTTGNAGFNSFFGSTFAVLGDTSGNITSTPDSGTSSISRQFTLPATHLSQPVTSYNLTIKFTSVFDGDDTGNTHPDVFSVTLLPPSGPAIVLYNQDSSPLPNCGPAASPTCADSQVTQNPFTGSGGSLNGLLPGTYTIVFQLNEANQGGTNLTNTAAGIDNVEVDAEGFFAARNPASLLMLALGLTGLGAIARRRLRA